MNVFQIKDPFIDLIDHATFRLLAGGFEHIQRNEQYSNKSPFNRLLLGKNGQGCIKSRHTTLTLKPGQLILIPTETEATYIKPKGVDFYWVYFRMDCFGCLDFFKLCPVPCLSRMAANALPLFRRMLVKAQSARLIDRIQTLMDLLHLLQPFLVHCPSDRSLEKHRQLLRLLPVLSFIEEHMKEPIRLHDLAKQVSLHPAYFSNLFSGIMGTTPIQYINHRRIERSKESLLISQLTIKEIASKTGFEDPLYFSRVFQKQTGMSPLCYRQTGFNNL